MCGMKYDFALIGANGIQGRIVSRCLLEDGYSVLLCANDDYQMENLIEHNNSYFALIDLRRMDRVKRTVKKAKAPILVNCAIDDFNLEVTELALELGMHYLDLGGAEDKKEKIFQKQLALHPEFLKKDLLGITGIGSTPGITNIMLRYAANLFDTIDTVHVGFAWTSNMPIFVTPFSMDAIEWEYTTSARILENGEFVERDPLDCAIDYSYRSIGKQPTQYAHHNEPLTFHEFLKDKGVKNIARFASYPPHSHQTILTLLKLGLLSRTIIEGDGISFRPLDSTREVLRRLSVPQGYEEKECLWLKIFGKKDGKEKKVDMDCVAGTLPGWEENTCNIDTGFPATILAEMMLKEEILERGMFTPEFIVPPEPFFAELGKRQIWVYENGKKLNGNGEK